MPPPENGFTHIGFYLAWVIHHDLHSPDVFPAGHVAAVKAGEMTGSDLTDDIDTKFNEADVNAEGRAFTDARYGAYLAEYEQLVAAEPPCSVVDDVAGYARVAPVIDRLHADWVRAGRPVAEPRARGR